MCAACAAKTHSFFVARIGVARRDLIGKVTSSAGPQSKRMTTEAHEVIRSASTISLPLAAHHEGRNSSPVLTRQLLEKGNIDALAAIDAPGLKLLTEADRIASLRETLPIRPQGDVWVFGYGSLIWNSAINSVERRIAKIDGWHRSFCLSITALRATADRPGLMLALDRGGSCHDAAYRIASNGRYGRLNRRFRDEFSEGVIGPISSTSSPLAHQTGVLQWVPRARSPDRTWLDYETSAHTSRFER